MMQVTPMWIPTTMPVVDVWLVTSSFRQSHGRLRAGGTGAHWACGCPGLKHPDTLDTQSLRTPSSSAGSLRLCLWDSSPTFSFLFTSCRALILCQVPETEFHLSLCFIK
jgi:hypothetical protein